MGKCEKIIEKGKKKNQLCGCYTNKKNNIDNKFYCSSHLKGIIDKYNNKNHIKENIIIEPIQQDKIIVDFKNCNSRIEELNKITLDNNYSLDECVEAIREKDILENKINNSNNDIKEAQNNHILDKLEDISERMALLEHKLIISKEDKLPEYEIYK